MLMNCFVLIARAEKSSVQARLGGDPAFEGHYQLGDGVWVVAGRWDTTVDLAQALRMDPDAEDSMSGVVVKCDEYYGLFDPGLWSKLAAWRDK